MLKTCDTAKMPGGRSRKTNDEPAVRVFCEERHINRRVKPKRADFNGVEKIRLNCGSCHRDYQRKLAQWEAVKAKLLAAGITSISLRDLERYG